MPHASNPNQVPQDPGYAKVRDFLLFGLSLPERALRSGFGVVGGTIRESASLLVPQAFRNSKTYSIMIQQMLDFLAEDVGGVERAGPRTDSTRNFVAQKAVGNFIDLASLATFHLSPMLLLAIIGDVAYGSRAYLKQLADDLKQQGIIDPHSTIDGLDDLLGAVGETAQTTASMFNLPPISVEGLKQTVDQTRSALARIDPTKVLPQPELQRLWNDIHQIAADQGLHPLAVSGAMTLYAFKAIGLLGRGALSTLTAAGNLLDKHIVAHYGTAVREMRRRGVYGVLRDTSRPYIEAVWKNFSPQQPTLTERWLSGRWIVRAWNAVRAWFRR